jgi:hydrogenase maturation protease
MSSVATAERSSTLVLGLGNPILGDDGVGWHVVDELVRRAADEPRVREALRDVELDRLAVGGLELMERLVGYRRAVIVDAMLGGAEVGSVHALPLEQVAGRHAGHLDSAHDVTLSLALSAGRALGAQLPVEITVVGVRVRVVDEFDDRLTPEVADAIGPAVEAVLEVLSRTPVAAG